jgi:putative ABC transport system substrate-binding protein
MRRRDLLSVIVGATAWPLAARAQQRAMPVIGWIAEVPPGPFVTQMVAAFRRGMAELGYLEGKNVAIEYRFRPESLPQAAADLVRLNVNAIFAGGPTALAAVSNATTSIPVVGVDLDTDLTILKRTQTETRP